MNKKSLMRVSGFGSLLAMFLMTFGFIDDDPMIFQVGFFTVVISAFIMFFSFGLKDTSREDSNNKPRSISERSSIVKPPQKCIKCEKYYESTLNSCPECGHRQATSARKDGWTCKKCEEVCDSLAYFCKNCGTYR